MNEKKSLLFLSFFLLNIPNTLVQAGILDDLREDLAFNYGKERLSKVILRLKKKAHMLNTQIFDSNDENFLFMSNCNLPSPTTLISESQQLSTPANELSSLIKLFHKHFPKESITTPASHASHEELCDFYHIVQKGLHGYEKRKNELENSPFFDPEKILPYLLDPSHRQGSEWYFWPTDHIPHIAGLGTGLIFGAAWKSYLNKKTKENLLQDEQNQQKVSLSTFGNHLKKRIKQINPDDTKGLHIAGISLIGLTIGLLAAKYFLEPNLLHEHPLFQELQPQHDLMENPPQTD